MHSGVALAELVALVHFQRRAGGAVQERGHRRGDVQATPDHRRRSAGRCRHPVGQRPHLGLGGAAGHGADAVGQNQRRPGAHPGIGGGGGDEFGQIAQGIHG